MARYRAYAQQASRRHTRARPLALTVGGWIAIVVLGAVVAARTADLVGGGTAMLANDVSRAIAVAFPSLEQRLQIDTTIGSVSAAPIVEELPAFTSQQRAMLQGRVPSFALSETRRVEIALNGKVVAVVTPDAQGRFAQQLALQDGSNEVALTLIDGEHVIATTSSTIVLDRTPPPLSLVRPTAGATIEGRTVTVEGKVEPDAAITVNGRVVTAAPDGGFSESFTAAAGPLQIEIVARDRAGNETKQSLSVTVRDAQPIAGAAIALSLDRTRVRPGEAVVADVTVLSGGRPADGASVQLFVGVVDLGATRTDRNGNAKIGFAAPTTEGEIAVVVLSGGASARTTLTVSR